MFIGFTYIYRRFFIVQEGYKRKEWKIKQISKKRLGIFEQ